MNRRIALVEDDDVLRDNYTDFLSRAGFVVDAYSTKGAALPGILATTPDLVLLNITLHRERDAGFAICAELRRSFDCLPIIFLTSHADEVDKISGLRVGADDYITKDVSLEYLIVRLEERANSLSGTIAAFTQPRAAYQSRLPLVSLISADQGFSTGRAGGCLVKPSLL
jgi:DNA-binding response OmpR family regulator